MSADTGSTPLRRPATPPAVAWSALVDWLTLALRADALERTLPALGDEADRHGATLAAARLDIEGLDLVADHADALTADEALVLAALRIRTSLPPWALLARTGPRQLTAVWVVVEQRSATTTADAVVDTLAGALAAVARRAVAAVDDGGLTVAARAAVGLRRPGGEPLTSLLGHLDLAGDEPRRHWMSPVNTISLLGHDGPIRVEGLPFPDLYLPAELRRMRERPVVARAR